MSPSHTRRRGRLYRYYVCSKSIRIGTEPCPVRSIAAAEIESVIFDQVRRVLLAPEVTARTIAACHELGGRDGHAAAREHEVLKALGRLDEVWGELFPAEQSRILRLLIERIDVAPEGVDLHLCIGGIETLASELVREDSDEMVGEAGDVTEEATA